MNPTQKTPAGRISIESVSTTGGGKTRHMPVGFPKESALLAAITAVMALVPEETDEQKAAKAKAKADLFESIRDNEPVLSFKIDPQSGQPDSQDWAILAGHPARLGKVVILGGGYSTYEQNARGGQYVKSHVRAPKALIEAAMAAWGLKPSPTLYKRSQQAQAQPVMGQGFQPNTQNEDTQGQGREEDFGL